MFSGPRYLHVPTHSFPTRRSSDRPKEWENQDKWKGGWVRNKDGSVNPKIGGKFRVLANIFANPDLPTIDDYYEPFDFDYQHLHTAPLGEHQPEIGRAHV